MVAFFPRALQSFWITAVSKFAPLVWLLGIIVVLGAGWLLWQRMPYPDSIKTLVLVGYVGLVWSIITRV